MDIVGLDLNHICLRAYKSGKPGSRLAARELDVKITQRKGKIVLLELFMARASDEILENYGGFRVGESQVEFAARVRQIDSLISDFKGGGISPDEAEVIQRKLCDLKGMSFEDQDEEFER
jgi:hypothetical protein